MPRLRVLSSAMGGNIVISEFLRPIAESLGMDFLTMSEWKEHDILWKKETWLEEIEKSDVVVCVSRHQEQPAKSANRAVQAMALGKPVLASPLPAYQAVISHGATGFICTSENDWKTALARLADPELRKKIGTAAKASVAEYSIQTVGSKWADFLKSRARKNCQPPKVDIIIATLDNLEYLKPCIESIRKATDWPHNIIVVSSGTKPETIAWIKAQPDVIHHISPVRLHFSAANNVGLSIAKESYVCLLNDDTIVGKGWLNALMHEAMKPGVGAVGPFSNCDRGWLHDETIMAGGRSLVPAMTMEDLAEVIPQIQDYRHAKQVVDRKWVAFYCTLLPREALDKVGKLDEGFLSGDEDVDYCKRLRDAGFRIVQTLDSWVFHFGGKTRKKADETDHERHQREDQANHAYFIKKWGVYPGDTEFRNQLVGAVEPKAAVPPPAAPRQVDKRPVFCLFTGEAWESWCPASIDQGGIGGSETATIYTARDFHRLGYRSIVIGDCKDREGAYDGVEYLHHTKLDQVLKTVEFDLFVSSRRADVFWPHGARRIRARKKACVVHDIWLSQDGGADLGQDQVDRYFVLSPWHRDFFLNHHRGVDPAKVVISRDGIDLARFDQKVRKDPGRMVYSSSADRGLDVLLDCMPEIRSRVPHANLHVFYGFDNWEKACRLRKNVQEIAWMESIKARLDDPGVTYHGRVGQTQLAKEMLRAEICCYPTYFTETFAISMVEQMAAGNPIVTSDLAALATTVGSAGILLKGNPRDEGYKREFIAEIVQLLTNKNKWAEYSRRSLEKAKTYSWTGIADEWLKLVGLDVPAK